MVYERSESAPVNSSNNSNLKPRPLSGNLKGVHFSFLFFSRWLSGRVLALHSVVASLISRRGDDGIHCRWDQLRSTQLSSVSVCLTQVFDGFSGHGISIHNIISLLKKKEKCTSISCPWGYCNYADAYFQSFWEDVTLEVTVSSVKSTNVTCKTHSG